MHARFLERAAQLSYLLSEGGMTTLPMVETQLGDVSIYIPTNVIFFIDGANLSLYIGTGSILKMTGVA